MTIAATRIIDNTPCVRVVDLAHQWHTSTASILATDKPHAIPSRYLHYPDINVWCELDGLRWRVEHTRINTCITRKISEYLDEVGKQSEPVASKPTADTVKQDTDSIARKARNRARTVAHRVTRQAARIDSLEDRVNKLHSDEYHRYGRLSQQTADLESRVSILEETMQAFNWTVAAFAAVAVIVQLAKKLRR